MNAPATAGIIAGVALVALAALLLALRGPVHRFTRATAGLRTLLRSGLTALRAQTPSRREQRSTAAHRDMHRT